MVESTSVSQGDGMRDFQEREVRLAGLSLALQEGEASGVCTPFDFEAFIAGRRCATTFGQDI